MRPKLTKLVTDNYSEISFIEEFENDSNVSEIEEDDETLDEDLDEMLSEIPDTKYQSLKTNEAQCTHL